MSTKNYMTATTLVAVGAMTALAGAAQAARPADTSVIAEAGQTEVVARTLPVPGSFQTAGNSSSNSSSNGSSNSNSNSSSNSSNNSSSNSSSNGSSNSNSNSSSNSSDDDDGDDDDRYVRRRFR